MPDTFATYVQGINNAGQVVGGYVDARFRSHGFLWRRTNSYSEPATPFDVAGAVETYGRGINSAGLIVGYAVDASGKHHGLFRTATGAVTPVDASGATDTYALGINDAGQVVGWFTDAQGRDHAFFRNPTTGAFITIDVPGALSTYAPCVSPALTAEQVLTVRRRIKASAVRSHSKDRCG